LIEVVFLHNRLILNVFRRFCPRHFAAD
jgi:hypothetical protein